MAQSRNSASNAPSPHGSVSQAADLTRRRFLGAGAATLGAAGLAVGSRMASAAPSSAGAGAASLPATWDYEADVVCVGAGGAGYMAAIAAAEKGSTAIIFEKQPTEEGDTVLCACEMCGAWPERTLADSGQQDSVDSYMRDWENSSVWNTRYYRTGEQYSGERVLTRREIELCPDTFQWLQDTAGVVWTTFEDSSWDPQPKWETVSPRNWRATDTRIIPQLVPLATSMGVQIVYEARVSRLVTNADGRVVGIEATMADGSRVTAKARKAVVMASGSFMREAWMVTTQYPEMLTQNYGCSAGACGDGHKMVLDIGGQLRDLDAGLRWAPVEDGSYSQKMMGSWFYCGITKPQVPGIFINLEGKRYAAESIGYSFSAYEMSLQPGRKAWWVVDATGAQNTHLFDDNEVSTVNDSNGMTVVKADTLEELAAGMNVDAETLAAEVERYNGFVDEGTDEDFGKVMDGTIRIETAPFYALLETGVPYNTYGGIATDVDSHVLDAQGDPIPGLYAAGSCCGSYAEQEGLYYTGGVVQAMTFGRQAGQNAADEQAWG